jgi:putative nucleotidyltransferase with HDIG domain
MDATRPVPPKFVSRALTASFFTVALVLVAVFVVMSVEVRGRVRKSVAENLASAQQLFIQVEARRQHEVQATVAILAENPTLKAALDTWLTERGTAALTTEDELLATVQRETDKLAQRVSADVLAITDLGGRVVVSSGPLSSAWPRGFQTAAPDNDPASTVSIKAGDKLFRVLSVRLELQDAAIGALRLGTALDTRYAQELAMLSRGQAAILTNGAVLASTLPPHVSSALASKRIADRGTAQVVEELAGESWAVQPLFQIGDARLLALASVDVAAARDTSAALTRLAWIALGAVSLAVLGSVWQARALTRPIDHLSRSITAMVAADRGGEPLPLSGTTRELDQLTAAFNSLMAARAAAEAEAEATYLGAVRAMTASLDARDPYTAGHSERVSTLSVAIGQELSFDPETIEILRLGALLHDVGKIGVPDEILRKPGRLTAREYDQIKGHPSAGARILKSIPFLVRHIPIVELHHERPDGYGYPYGLKGDAIPVAARIVHVADAFDAMTSARAYRPALLPVEAITELRRGAGTDFDAIAVEALVAALAHMAGAERAPEAEEIQWISRARIPA